jgi:hypothetical protein
MPDPLSLSILVLLALLPTVLVTVAMLHVNKRLMAENRELLKATLALSEKPAAAALAGMMEQTDRATMHAERQNQQPTPRPRMVGQ